MASRSVAPLIAVLAFFALPASATAAITEFPLPTSASSPAGVAAGPDGNVWVAEPATDRIARVTPAGAVTEFTLVSRREPLEVASAGGLIWFTERNGDRIGRLDPSAPDIQGSITEFIVPGAGSHPTGITAGPDGNLW